MTRGFPVDPALPVDHQSHGRRAARSISVTATAQLIKFVCQFTTVVALARLLVPSDVGLIAMVAPILGFSLLFQDLGLSQAIVTSPKISDTQAATLFWANVGVASAVAILLAVVSPLIAGFYRQPQLTLIVLAMSTQVVFFGLTSSHLALLVRAMRFGDIAKIDVLSAFIGCASAIVIAFVWPSPWAVAAQSIVTSAIMMLGVWYVSGWRPFVGAPIRSVTHFLRFGAGMTTANLMNYIARNADNLLLGWMYGAGQLGLYDRAYKLLLFPVSQINAPVANVLIPTLSRLVDEPDRYKRLYMATVRQLLLFTAPGTVVLVIAADVIINVLMGHQWLGVVPIFRWLGLAAGQQILSNTFGWLFMSQRRAGDYARYSIFGAAVCVISFIVGLRWQAEGVAAAYSISGILVRLPSIIWVVGQRGPVGRLDIVKMFAPYVAGMTIAIGVAMLLMQHFSSSPLLYIGQITVLVFSIMWGVLACTEAGRATIINTYRMSTYLMEVARGKLR